jgi:hypothetical protein
MIRMFRSMLLILSLSVLSLAADVAAPRAMGLQVRVYVYTEKSPSGPVTDEEKGRLDTVNDIREALRKDIRIVLVPNRSDAQVVVEVLNREKREASIGGFGGTSVGPSGEVVVQLRVKWGDEQTEIKGTALGYWGRAAKDAADRLSKWIARISAKVKD